MNRNSLRGFTLVELLVVISIIGILMAMLMPALQSIRANVRTTQCQNNLSQIGIGVKAFVAAQSGKMRKFDPVNWNSIVLPYMSNQNSMLGCAELNSGATAGYGCNNLANLFNEGDSRKIIILDFNNKLAEVVGLSMADVVRAKNWDAGKASRHAGLCNVLYNDGHVDSKNLDDIDPVVSDIHAYWWLPVQRKFERAVTYVDIPGLLAEYRRYDTHGNSMSWDGSADSTNIALDLNLPFGAGWDNQYGDAEKHPLYPYRLEHYNDTYYKDPHTSSFTGQIKFPTTDSYRFWVGSDDDVWITVSGSGVNFSHHNGYTGGIGSGPRTDGTVSVQSDTWYDFQVKHDNHPRTGTYMYVMWEAASVPRQHIPTSAFRLKPP